MIIKITPQIEEMARTLCGEKEKSCAKCDSFDLCEFWIEASILHNADYRKQEWISVEERLPERSCECLVATNIGGIYQVSYSHRYKAFNALDTDEAKYAMLAVTHWMPLPNPPKGE